MVMAMNSEYRGSTYGATAAPKKKPTAKKTKATPGTKVSQKTIDNIKSMGMKNTLEALKSIGQPGSRNVASSKEFIEGARRMYGSRVDKYLPASKPTSSGGGKYVGSRFVPNTPAKAKTVYKSADEARAAAMKNNKPGPRIPSKAGFGVTNKPSTSTANKPTAAQIASAKARAGGNASVYSSSRTAPAKTQAQIAKAAREAAARKKAVAAARKAAGGRNI
jgi:hypothetical protein